MSKSVFVVDTPENCSDCIFCQKSSIGSRKYAYCYVTNGDSENDMKLINVHMDIHKAKPEWCPLTSLPEEDHKNYYPDEWEDGYADGWNDCLREITGDKHE